MSKTIKNNNNLKQIFITSDIKKKSSIISQNEEIKLDSKLDSNLESEQLSDQSSDSDIESETTIESEPDEIDPNEEPLDEYEKEPDIEIEPEADIEIDNIEETETEKETEIEKEVIDIEYNEDGINEIDTEKGIINDDDCIYQYDDLVEERDNEKQILQIPNNQRITDSIMTHYEKIRILGIRTKQIAMGAKVMVKYDNNMSAIELAKYELINKTTPLIIKRPLPNNSYELWKVSELNIDNNEKDNKLLIADLNNSFYDNNVDKYILII